MLENDSKRALLLASTLFAALACGDDGGSDSSSDPQVGTVPGDIMGAYRCGVAGDWLSSAELGAVVSTGDDPPEEQTAEFIDAASTLAGVSLPRSPVYDVEVDTVVYTTQDRGQLIEASTLIAYPTNVDPDTPITTLLFLHGTSGFTDGCGVSGDSASALLIAYVASLGYAVAAPDYIGLKTFGEPTGFLHPYLVGEPTAIASLDAVRALRRQVRAGHPELSMSSRVALLGGSQGGHAVLWVDRLAPYYAQELELIGGVATVPPADVLAQIERALQVEVPASANSVAFFGTAMDWYGLRDRSDEVFLPRTPTVPEALAGQCNPTALLEDATLETLFSADILAAAAANDLEGYDVWGCMAAQSSLNRTAIPRITPTPDSYGLLYVVGELDDLVHPPIQRESFTALCEDGIPLSYLECAGASHTRATYWALPEILDYLDARAAGEPVAGACELAAAVRCAGTTE